MFNSLGDAINSMVDHIADMIFPLDDPIDWLGSDDEDLL